MSLSPESILLIEPLFYECLAKFKSDFSQANTLPPTCAISYAWPTTAQERDAHVHERVLRVAEDLACAGVSAQLDIVWGTKDTDFKAEQLSRIQTCNFALLLGTPSYALRALDQDTLTHLEVKELKKKAEKTQESVIACVLEGEFAKALPKGYSEIMCALLTQKEYFFQLPDIAAKIYGCNPTRLAAYKKQLQQIIDTQPTTGIHSNKSKEQAQLKEKEELKMQHWSVKVLLHTAKFTLLQKQLLDGEIARHAQAIANYCKSETQDLSQEVPPDDTDTTGPTLQERLLNFLDLESTDAGAKVLLLQAPNFADMNRACRFLAWTAWSELQWVPVWIDLTQLKDPFEHIVEQALEAKGLDRSSITQVREQVPRFLLIIKGYDSLGMETNLYMRDQLFKWPGKAVFTCHASYGHDAPHWKYYFMPAVNQRANRHGLKIVTFATQNASDSIVMIPKFHKSKANTVSVQTKEGVDTSEERKNFSTTSVSLTEGMLLLQRSLLQPTLHAYLKRLAAMPSTSRVSKVFISYAWPPVHADCAKLQERLLQIVDDLAVANIDVVLDIRHLTLGRNINDFMLQEVQSSDAVLWIGTPRLKERIDNFPGSNVAIEYTHICEKYNQHPGCLYRLWFHGENFVDAFPTNLPQEVSNLPIYYFNDLSKYYHEQLPQLAATLLGVAATSGNSEAFSSYCEEVSTLSAEITSEKISNKIEEVAELVRQQNNKTASDFERRLSELPQEWHKAQASVHKALEQELLERIHQFQQRIVAEHSGAQAHYIPLMGADLPSTTACSDFFRVAERASNFLQDKTERVLLIQGGAGTGKSMFARHLELLLWQEDSEPNIHPFPLFISLPQSRDAFRNLAETTLLDNGFTRKDIEELKQPDTTVRIIFILDSLDELPIDKVPPTGILVSNNLFEWPHAKFVITCRPEYLTAISQYYTPYRAHLLQDNKTNLGEVFLMPFDYSQVNQFLMKYVEGGNTEWTEWTHYRERLDTIGEFTSTNMTPFILKLLVDTLPQLCEGDTEHTTINQSDIYGAFTNQLAASELYKQVTNENVPLSEDRLAQYRKIACDISLELFRSGSTSFNVRLNHAQRKLLRGVPIHRTPDGVVSFIHKSLQEYFTNQAWDDDNQVLPAGHLKFSGAFYVQRAYAGVQFKAPKNISFTHKFLRSFLVSLLYRLNSYQATVTMYENGITVVCPTVIRGELVIVQTHNFSTVSLVALATNIDMVDIVSVFSELVQRDYPQYIASEKNTICPTCVQLFAHSKIDVEHMGVFFEVDTDSVCTQNGHSSSSPYPEGKRCKTHDAMCHDVFINYRVRSMGRKTPGTNEPQRGIAELFYTRLSVLGKKNRMPIFVFWDVLCFNDGSSWKREYINGVMKAKVIVVLLSNKCLDFIANGAKEQDNVLSEIEIAIIRNKKHDVPVIPVYLSEFSNGNYQFFQANHFLPDTPHRRNEDSQAIIDELCKGMSKSDIKFLESIKSTIDALFTFKGSVMQKRGEDQKDMTDFLSSIRNVLHKSELESNLPQHIEQTQEKQTKGEQDAFDITTNLKVDITNLKMDITNLKIDITNLKSEVATLKRISGIQLG